MAGIGNSRCPTRVSGPFGDALSRRSHLPARASARTLRPAAVARRVGVGCGDRRPERRSAPMVTQPREVAGRGGRDSVGDAAVVPGTEAALKALRCHTEQGAAVAGAAAALPLPLHPDFVLMVELGGALVRRDHEQGYPSRVVRERPGLGADDLRVRGAFERERPPLRLERDRRPDPQEDQACTGSLRFSMMR